MYVYWRKISGYGHTWSSKFLDATESISITCVETLSGEQFLLFSYFSEASCLFGMNCQCFLYHNSHAELYSWNAVICWSHRFEPHAQWEVNSYGCLYHQQVPHAPKHSLSDYFQRGNAFSTTCIYSGWGLGEGGYRYSLSIVHNLTAHLLRRCGISQKFPRGDFCIYWM